MTTKWDVEIRSNDRTVRSGLRFDSKGDAEECATHMGNDCVVVPVDVPDPIRHKIAPTHIKAGEGGSCENCGKLLPNPNDWLCWQCASQDKRDNGEDDF